MGPSTHQRPSSCFAVPDRLAAADASRPSTSPPGLAAAGDVSKWRRRFAQCGLDGRHDEPRPGKPRTISDHDVKRDIVKTLEEQPRSATHWSTRSMAAATGISQSAISPDLAGLRAQGLSGGHLQAVADPQFIDKVHAIVGCT